MKPIGHLITSIAGAGLIYSISNSLISALAFFTSGILIDLDHVFDYVYHKGLKNFTIKNLSDSCYVNKLEKFTMVFHSYELLFVLWIIITFYKLNIFWISFALGLSVHLILDQLTNPALAYTYFFTFRWIKKFKTKHFIREE